MTSRVRWARGLAVGAALALCGVGAAGAISTADTTTTAACHLAEALTGPPAGGMFAGHTYNGHGATLPAGSYTVGPDTCITGWTFPPGSPLTFAANPTDVTIVNDRFVGPFPRALAIPNVSGNNVRVEYNDFDHVTAAEGHGPMTDVTFSHNLITDSPVGADGVHLFFGHGEGGHVSSNIHVDGNKITGNGRYPIEVQEVVHKFTADGNYVVGGPNSSGEISVSLGNDQRGIGGADSSGIEVARNVIDGNGYHGPGYGSIEIRGPGANVHDNKIKNPLGIIYAQTGNSGQIPWRISGNTIIGGTIVANGPEGSGPEFGANVKPTVEKTVTFPAGASLPVWNDPVGVQPSMPDMSAVGPPNSVSAPNRQSSLPETPSGTPTADTPTIPTPTDTTSPAARPNFLPIPLPTTLAECVPS